MTEETGKIAKIIQEQIWQTVEDEKKIIHEESARLEDKAVERINGVYSSILKAIAGLEIKDPTVLDYIEKTKGNIRVYDNIIGRGPHGELETNYCGQTLGYQHPGKQVIKSITLNDNKKYRIIVMAIEEGDVKVE